MKYLILLVTTLCMSFSAFAQQDTTTFIETKTAIDTLNKVEFIYYHRFNSSYAIRYVGYIVVENRILENSQHKIKVIPKYYHIATKHGNFYFDNYYYTAGTILNSDPKVFYRPKGLRRWFNNGVNIVYDFKVKDWTTTWKKP